MDLKAYLLEIDTVTGAEIQSQLRDAFANRFHIAEKTVFKAINSDANSGPGLNLKAVKPFGE